MEDLAPLRNRKHDKAKATRPIWREARKLCCCDFPQRFLKNNPKEYDGFTFVSVEDERGMPDFEFQRPGGVAEPVR